MDFTYPLSSIEISQKDPKKNAEMPQRWDVPSEANVLDIECMKDLSKNNGPPSNRKIMI